LNDYSQLRDRMVEEQLAGRGIQNPRVLEAMHRVPRHEFVPQGMEDRAYQDCPLPIGHGQTISQPYIVALMTELADPQPMDKALDVGTGSGYQAAVLAELVHKVFCIEIVESLATQSRERLQALGYNNIQFRTGDGYHGWEDVAPFDIILAAAAACQVPPALTEQLAPGGRLILPVGDRSQYLQVVEKSPDGSTQQRKLSPVAFVTMTGAAIKEA
jgi:protein-L-isoaspartate(D-aspartate) O-methyltransferase